MKKLFTVVWLAACVVPPVHAAAQLGVAGRVGTLGIGAEAALSLTERFVLRGGIGFSNLEANTSFDGVPVALELPDRWTNVGVDLYLNGAFRVGGGVVFKPKDVAVRGVFSDPVDLGGEVLTPSEVGTLSGRISSNRRAPYVLIGFGKHTASGFGLSLDLGAAILGTPSTSLAASGGTYPSTQLDTLLAQEALDFDGSMKTYMKVWPILSLGLRMGFG